MNETTWDAARRAAADVLAVLQVQGIVLIAAEGDQEPLIECLGTDAAGVPLTPESLFPVASVMKLGVALAVLRLVEQGKVELDALLGTYVPRSAARDSATVRTLLCHISGLPLDLPEDAAPYEPSLDWTKLAEACLKVELEAPPSTRVQYSNVGFGLLAILVEEVAGLDFADALDALVLAPLGVQGWLGKEPPVPPIRVGGVRGSHLGTELEPFNSRFWRSLGLPWGGLVTTPPGAFRLLQAFQGRHELISRALLAEATRNQVGDLGGGLRPPLWWPRAPWGLGPELRGEKSPHWAPAEASQGSFGHAGASGCVVWADPAHDVAWGIFGAVTADSGWLIKGAPLIGAPLLVD